MPRLYASNCSRRFDSASREIAGRFAMRKKLGPNRSEQNGKAFLRESNFGRPTIRAAVVVPAIHRKACSQSSSIVDRILWISSRSPARSPFSGREIWSRRTPPREVRCQSSERVQRTHGANGSDCGRSAWIDRAPRGLSRWNTPDRSYRNSVRHPDNGPGCRNRYANVRTLACSAIPRGYLVE